MPTTVCATTPTRDEECRSIMKSKATVLGLVSIVAAFLLTLVATVPARAVAPIFNNQTLTIAENSPNGATTTPSKLAVFDPEGQPLAAWDIDGWLDKEVVGKPYLAVDAQSRVYVADEVSQRILVFDQAGQYLGGFGQYGVDDRGFTLPGGIAVDQAGFIYVTDTASGRVLKFPPFEPQ